MLQNAENIALQSLQILNTFVLRAKIPTIFGPNVVGMWWEFPHAIQKYTKFANFARLYCPHFTTFRNQTL
jgi:hypothetical protein